jgi:tetratricopeptide (TPR) repeat protein/tRNA A-37 threonylcarbamoyl transferase component Bud32
MLLEIIRENAEGHPPDDLAAWAATIGATDRQEEERFIRKMIRQEVQMNLDESAESGKICPGVVIEGRYHLLRLLGEGGMGQVFEAEHLGIEKRVAIKVLHERVLNDQVAVARFKREAMFMGGLRHPNIVEVSDYGETEEGNYFLVMELLTGDTLAARIAKGTPIPADEIIPIMISVCQGLHAAHDAGVIHRDLKPENIFLTDSGPKIVDFGIAKRADLEQEESSLTRTGNICGTVEYISPEQLRGLEIDHRVDIYTAGLIIYEALTGDTPFRGRNVAETMHRVMTDKVVPPRKRTGDLSIPQRLENLCLRAMSREASKRYQNATEMRIALENLFETLGRFEEIPPLTLWDKIWHQRRLIFAVAAGLALVFVSAVALDYLFDKRNMTAPPTSVPVFEESEKPSEGEEVPRDPPEQHDTPLTPEPTGEPKPPAGPDSRRQKEIEKQARKAAQAEVKKLIEQGEEARRKMRWKRAEELFKRALEIDPASSRAWFDRGQTAYEQGNSRKAITWVQKALQLSPSRAEYRNYLGKIYMAIDSRDRAIKEWRRVLRSYPNNKEAKNLLKEAGEEV